MSMTDIQNSKAVSAAPAPCPRCMRKLQNRHGKIWLNVGGGNSFLDGFVNIDSNFLVFLAPFYPAIKPVLKKPARDWLEMYKAKRRPNNFVFANCRLPLKFPDNSVDHILISHFLEHLHYDDAVSVLKNYYSILKPGGALHIIIPDLAQKAREYVSHIGDAGAAESFVDGLLFRRRHIQRLSVRILQLTGWFDFEHCFMYDLASLSKLVGAAGFAIVPQNNSPSASYRVDDPCQVNVLARKLAE